MIATDAKFKAHPLRRECQKREAVSQEFCRSRSGAHARQNCEKPPFDRHAGRARICIGKGCEYAVLTTERQETEGRQIHAVIRNGLRQLAAIWYENETDGRTLSSSCFDAAVKQTAGISRKKRCILRISCGGEVIVIGSRQSPMG